MLAYQSTFDVLHDEFDHRVNCAVVRDVTHVECLGADDAYLLALRGRVGPSHVDTVVTFASDCIKKTYM